MTTLLDLKRKITKQLEEDNEKIRAERINFALDYASLLAVTFMRRVLLIKLKSYKSFVQLEYDYKVYKSKKVLASYFLTDCIDMMKKAKGDIDKGLIRFMTTMTDTLELPFASSDKQEKGLHTGFSFDHEHIALLRELMIELQSFCTGLSSEPKKVLAYTITRLEVLEMKYDKHSIEGFINLPDWKKEAQRQTKIKML